MPVHTHKQTQKGSNRESMQYAILQRGTRMIKLENGGLRAPLKISLGSGLHSQKGIRAPVSKNDRAPGSTAEISGLQGSRPPPPPPFGTLFLCAVVYSGCALVNYHAIEISSS